MASPDWNERYKAKEIPWDTNEPDENLVKLISAKTVLPCKALEIGCGTGTNLYVWHTGIGEGSGRMIDASPFEDEEGNRVNKVCEEDIGKFMIRNKFEGLVV